LLLLELHIPNFEEDDALNPAMEACHIGYAQRLVQLHEQMLVSHHFGGLKWRHSIPCKNTVPFNLRHSMAHTNNARRKHWLRNRKKLVEVAKKFEGWRMMMMR
jgi:hypothetical protein